MKYFMYLYGFSSVFQGGKLFPFPSVSHHAQPKKQKRNLTGLQSQGSHELLDTDQL